MAEGHLSIPLGSKFEYNLEGIRQAQNSVKAVAYAMPSWWRSPAGQRYQQENFAVVKRGVTFIRVFLQERRILQEYEDVIEAQAKAGITVYTADPKQCPQELLGDYVIIDDRILVRLELALDGHPWEECITIEPVQVSKAVKQFEDLLYLAEAFDSKVLPGQSERQGVKEW
jgi:N-dimethylarginine dimethylaminohydrolase